MTSFALWLVGVGARLASLGLTTASVVVLARSLGPAGRGQYFVVVTFVLVLAAVADLGMSQTALVFTGRAEAPIARIHRMLIRLATATGLALALIGGLLIAVAGDQLFPGVPREWMYYSLILIPLGVYANSWTGMMLGARRLIEVNAIQLASNGLVLLANLLLVSTTRNTAVALAIYAAALAIQATAMFTVTGRMRGFSDIAEKPDLARRMIAFGLRGYPNTLSTLVWARSAVFVLSALHGPSAVGIYSVAQQIAEKALVPIQAMQDLMYARMAQLPRVDATAALNRYLRVTLALIIPTIAIAIFLSPAIVVLLFSETFSGGVVPLRLLLLGSAIQSVPILLAPYFLSQLRRPGLLSLLAWLNAALHVVLLLMFVPEGAEIGAAAAMLVTQIVGPFIVFATYLRLGRTDPLSALVLRRDDIALVAQQALALIRR